MRIRKRYQNLLQPSDLSSPLPPSATSAAAAVAPPVAAAGGQEGDAVTAAAAGRASGGGCDGGGGRGLHPNERSTNPTTCQPFLPPPSAPAAAGGEERGDLAPPGPRLPTRDVGFDHGHGRKVPKREPEGENGRDIGDAHNGDNAPVPKSLGAEASEVSEGHDGLKMLPNGAAAVVLAVAEAVGMWSDEEGELPLKKRRGGFHVRGRSFGLLEAKEDDDEEDIVPEREMEQRRPSRTRRRRYTAASRSITVAASGTVLTSAGNASNGGAPTATGDGTSATKKCDYMVVKKEGGEVIPPPPAALADGNRGGGNGKKRRSPAVLMEGSRCSRVNGRGWRCCQQTLVGYSLCEHHLGKGRLRSVSSVRCNGRARKKEDVGDLGAAAPPLPSLLRQQDQLPSGDGEDEEEEKKPGKRRRNKIGMVKARSISSLLHQPDHPPTPTVAIAAPPQSFPCPSPTPAKRPVTAAVPPSYGSDTAVA